MHLGDLLPVRGGLWTLDHYKERLAGLISTYMHHTGRQWRSLEDTARDSYHLRGGSRNWANLRRGQDYYIEGIFIWLEVDAIIREKSDGRNSLDDFCRDFLGGEYPDEKIRPFGIDEIIGDLNKLAKNDWRKFFEERVQKPQERMPLDFVQKLGYRLEYSSEPSEDRKVSEKNRKYAGALDSIGISVGEDGIISSDVVPGMPGDLAGLAPGMKIIGVNGREFSLDRFRDGVADSVVKGNIEFLVLDGDKFVTHTVDYKDGLKYLKLVRDEARPDLMEKIYAPRGELIPVKKDEGDEG
jgi:predicted metalloprotease with PDZ domain